MKAHAGEPYYIRGLTLGPVRRRGWVRPGLTVHLAKYDRMAAIGETTAALSHSIKNRPHWRDAGWGDSDVICCKLCARILWPRWLHDGACDGVEQGRAHTITAGDNWPTVLDDAGRRAPMAFLNETSESPPDEGR